MNLDDCDRLFWLQLFRSLPLKKSSGALWFLRVLNSALARFIDHSSSHLSKVIRYDFSVILRVLNRTLARFIDYSSLY